MKAIKTLPIFAMLFIFSCCFISPTVTEPITLSAKVIDSSSVRLMWEDDFINVRNYVLERKVETEEYGVRAIINGYESMFIDTTLSTDIEYKFRIYAITEDSLSDYSKELSVIIDPEYFKMITLTANVVDSASIQLTWEDNYESVRNYLIERKTGSNNFSVLAMLSEGDTSFTDTLLNSGTLYCYRMYAIIGDKVLNYSNEVLIAIPTEIDIDIDLVFVHGGSFSRGDVWGNGIADEQPVRTVTVNDFYIGKYEVTQALYVAIIGENPSTFQSNDNLPIETLKWFDAVYFCNALSEAEGLEPVYMIYGTDVSCDFTRNGYRLPTEAEWEYAARSRGRDDRQWSGTDSLSELVNYAWYNYNREETSPVGTKQANDLGIHDMSGNVWEMCWDWNNPTYYQNCPLNNPTGPNSGTYRIDRGGSFGNNSEPLRTSNRNGLKPTIGAFRSVGFRLARNAG